MSRSIFQLHFSQEYSYNGIGFGSHPTIGMISPWAPSAAASSPDGATTALIEDAVEISMGAPTSGELVLSNGMRRTSCNPSIVWSDCSRFLAVPQWTETRKQRLMVISIERRESRYVGGEYRVLELHAFRDGVVSGVDSPSHRPVEIRVDTSRVEW